ncbi:hypothetical protein BB559_000970 [Furculomyces boomerangus]|uniref:Protein transport protein Sec24C n=1 Tax=Furculomyces boomerangus TaxID=61424 RepID=A0A2T9Z3I1_9FUNG|nr:hypothetical protein BB559_000970 [Furculomyces boomerangus]
MDPGYNVSPEQRQGQFNPGQRPPSARPRPMNPGFRPGQPKPVVSSQPRPNIQQGSQVPTGFQGSQPVRPQTPVNPYSPAPPNRSHIPQQRPVQNTNYARPPISRPPPPPGAGVPNAQNMPPHQLSYNAPGPQQQPGMNPIPQQYQIGAPQHPQGYPQNYGHYNQPQDATGNLSQQMGSMSLQEQANIQQKHRARRVYATGEVQSSNQYQNTSPAIGAPQMFTPAAQPPKPNTPFTRNYASPTQTPAALNTPYDSQKPRIDPNQMPSPVAVHALNQDMFLDQPYVTSQKVNVPLASTQFTCVDEGNANPMFVRMTMANIPNTEELLKVSKLPLGMMIQPLADISPQDTQTQTVDFGTEGPIRCKRCKSYINPYIEFIEGGKRFICNLCKHENDVPEDYFCNLDMTGRRLDWELRPELKNGTIEFVATQEFMSGQSGPAGYIFAIDVSWGSVQSGMIKTCTEAIKNLLYKNTGLPNGVLFGIITYDRGVHFYNISHQMLVVSDIRNVFVPLSEGFLVDPYESRHIIEPLLDNLPQMFSNTRTAEAVLGPVVQAAHEALKGRGGKLFAFQTNMPTLGPGTLRNRDDPKLHNTDKEKTLYQPQYEFYNEMGVKYVDEGISANFYLFPNSYVDIATLSQLPNVTSGEVYMYPSFNINRDGSRFTSDLINDATRNFGFNGVMRVRCSDGLRIDEYFGNLYMRNHVDVELSGITSDTAIGVSLKHDGRLDEKDNVYFQVALLYTTSDGRRRIRVHNMAVPCTTLIGNMFRYAEIDTSMNLIAKMAVAEAKSVSLRNIRDNLTNRCIQILSAYRKNCASGSSPGQLILPEAYKLLPIYTLSFIKSPALRGGVEMQIDDRTYHMFLFNTMNVKQSLRYFYPRIAPVHELPPPPSEGESLTLPTLVRASYSLLENTGIYLVQTNCLVLTMWIGRQVDPSVLNDLFGVSALDQINPLMSRIPTVDSELNKYVQKVSFALVNSMYTLPTDDELEAAHEHIKGENFDMGRTYNMPCIQVIRQAYDSHEIAFANTMVEDKNNDNMSYVDYLCHIHRQIQTETRSK